MPVVSEFNGIVIMMHYEKGERHHTPHFHVLYGSNEAVVTLNGEIRDFNARKELFGLPCYRELANDPALFETAHVDYNTVVWNKQPDVDPDWLYHQSTPVHN